MKKFYIRLASLLLLCFTCHKTYPQDSHPELCFGFSIQAQELPEKTNYNAFLIMFPFTLYKISIDKAGLYLDIYAEPQINLVSLTTALNPEMEFGFNLGFRFNLRLNSFIYFAGIGSGPHYITARTKRQSGGFLFSNNLFIGVSKQLDNLDWLSLQLRGRHMSNAGLKEPNAGINNLFLAFSYRKNL